MFIDNDVNKEHFDSINVVEFKEELYNFVRDYNFSSLNLDILFNEINNSKEFENRILELICFNLGYSFQELIDNLNFSRIDTDLGDVNKLIFEQEVRIKKLIIHFIYEELPFNYLIKISKMKGKFNIKKDIREDIIKLLYSEIEKSKNLEDTLNIIQNTIDSKTQNENYVNIARKISLKSDKVVTENKFLIGLLDEIPLENLEKIVDNIIADKLVWDNLE